MYIFKKGVHITQVSVKLMITTEKSSIKVEHVQLFCNEMEELKIVHFFKIHYPIFTFPFTLRAETFAGRNFRVFRVFGPFSRKFMPLEISKQQNAKVFSGEIIDNFKNAKVFSREKKLFSKQI